MTRLPLLAFVLLLLPAVVSAADWPDTTAAGKTLFLGGSVQYGGVLQSNDFVKGKNGRGEPIERFASLRLELGWQTGGEWPWQHLYGFPSYGVGIYAGEFFEFSDEVGTPSALYGWFSWPVKRWGDDWRLSVESGLGLSANWKPFDPVTNPNNIALGAFRAIYIDVGATAARRLGRFEIAAGLRGTHFSNGGTKKPNLGLNLLAPSLELRYDFEPPRPLPERRSAGPFSDRWEVVVAGAFGVDNRNFDTRDENAAARYRNVDYPVLNASLGGNRWFGHVSKVGAGVDVTWSDATGASIDTTAKEVVEPASTGEKLALGVFGGYEQVIDRASVLLQLGYQVARTEFPGSLPAFYQRLGVKYHVSGDVFLGLNVRFHEFSRADHLELNLGYRWLR